MVGNTERSVLFNELAWLRLTKKRLAVAPSPHHSQHARVPNLTIPIPLDDDAQWPALRLSGGSSGNSGSSGRSGSAKGKDGLGFGTSEFITFAGQYEDAESLSPSGSGSNPSQSKYNIVATEDDDGEWVCLSPRALYIDAVRTRVGELTPASPPRSPASSVVSFSSMWMVIDEADLEPSTDTDEEHSSIIEEEVTLSLSRDDSDDSEVSQFFDDDYQ